MGEIGEKKEEKQAQGKKDLLQAFFCFLLNALVLCIAFGIAGFLPGGSKASIWTDTMDQMAGISRMLAEHLRQGRSLYYSFETSLGQNITLLYSFCSGGISILFYLLIGDTYIATILCMMIKIALASGLFSFFLARAMRIRGAEGIFFSLCYGLAGFQFQYAMSLNLLDAMYLLPLVMLAVFVMVRGNRVLPLTLSYALCFWTHFYLAFIIGLVSLAAVGVLLYLRDGKVLLKNNRKLLLRLLWGGVASVLAGLLLLLPGIMFYLHDSGGFNLNVERKLPLITDLIYPLYWGRPTTMVSELPYLYCGIPVFFLLPLYFWNKNIDRKERVAMGICTLSYFVTMYVEPVYLFLHMMNRPDGFTVRYAFCYSFLFVCLAARGFSKREEVAKGRMGIYLLLQLLLCAVCMVLHIRLGEVTDKALPVSAILGSFILIGLWGILGMYYFGAKGRGNNTVAGVCAFLLLAAELGGQAWFNGTEQGLTDRENLTFWEEQNSAFMQFRENAIAEDNHVYRSFLGNHPMVDHSSWLGIAGIGQFASANYSALQKFWSLMGDAVSAMRYTYVGGTELTDMLFGIRYQGSMERYDQELDSQKALEAFSYERALPMGYMVSEQILQPLVFHENTFENQNLLVSAMCGEEIRAYEDTTDYGGEVYHLLLYRDENGYHAVNTGDSPEGYGYFKLYLPTKEYEHAYVYFPLSARSSEEVSERRLPDTFASNVTELSYGDRRGGKSRGEASISIANDEMQREGDQFTVAMLVYDGPEKSYDFYDIIMAYQREEELDRAYAILSDNVWQEQEWSDTRIRAVVEVPEDRPVLFLSIPYDRGWTLLVDGVQTQILPVVLDTFMGAELTPGRHEIELRYRAPGAVAGVICFVIGIIAILLLGWYEVKQDFKGKQELPKA